MNPLISIIVPTYNRAATIERTLNSILAQTYSNYEIIVVEDGSKDNTLELLQKYNDSRMRIIQHEKNKGVTAAKNTGLNNIRGEWFTILDSDDEIVPDALEVMMKIPTEMDPTVTAVSCNCIDTEKGTFSGSFLQDQYVDFKTLMSVCYEEYWGITKTSVLMNDRLNELLGGYESTLWFKINDRANRYYVHKALRIFHTEGADRISKYKPPLKKLSNHYNALLEEVHYLESMKTYLPGDFIKDCVKAMMYLIADGKKESAEKYLHHINQVKGYSKYKLIAYTLMKGNAFLAKKSISAMQMIIKN